MATIKRLNMKRPKSLGWLYMIYLVPVYFSHVTRSLSKSIWLWLTLVWAHGVQASFTTVRTVDVVFPSSQYLSRSLSATTRFFYNYYLVQKTSLSSSTDDEGIKQLSSRPRLTRRRDKAYIKGFLKTGDVIAS